MIDETLESERKLALVTGENCQRIAKALGWEFKEGEKDRDSTTYILIPKGLISFRIVFDAYDEAIHLRGETEFGCKLRKVKVEPGEVMISDEDGSNVLLNPRRIEISKMKDDFVEKRIIDLTSE